MHPTDTDDEATTLLLAGDKESLAKLLPLVYAELRQLASQLLAHERPDHTLQPTALVHEAYIRLIENANQLSWQNRAHFFGIAANSMRQILVNHAEARNAAKRGGDRTRVTLDTSAAFSHSRDLDVLALNEAMLALAEIDKRQAAIVELRFFAGMTIDETAEYIGISAATVSREWEMARAWLFRRLTKGFEQHVA